MGELKAVAGRLLDSGRHWLAGRRQGMKRQRDWHEDNGRRGRDAPDAADDERGPPPQQH